MREIKRMLLRLPCVMALHLALTSTPALHAWVITTNAPTRRSYTQRQPQISFKAAGNANEELDNHRAESSMASSPLSRRSFVTAAAVFSFTAVTSNAARADAPPPPKPAPAPAAAAAPKPAPVAAPKPAGDAKAQGEEKAKQRIQQEISQEEAQLKKRALELRNKELATIVKEERLIKSKTYLENKVKALKEARETATKLDTKLNDAGTYTRFVEDLQNKEDAAKVSLMRKQRELVGVQKRVKQIKAKRFEVEARYRIKVGKDLVLPPPTKGKSNRSIPDEEAAVVRTGYSIFLGGGLALAAVLRNFPGWYDDDDDFYGGGGGGRGGGLSFRDYDGYNGGGYDGYDELDGPPPRSPGGGYGRDGYGGYERQAGGGFRGPYGGGGYERGRFD